MRKGASQETKWMMIKIGIEDLLKGGRDMVLQWFFSFFFNWFKLVLVGTERSVLNSLF